MTLNTELLFGKNPAAGGYQIERSLRFNSSDSAYLSRNFSSAGDKRQWTWSGWLKRSTLGGTQTLFGGGSATPSNNLCSIEFDSDRLRFYSYTSGSLVVDTYSAPIYRDAGAWMHLLVRVDTATATPANRIIFYVNGAAVTRDSNNPSQSVDLQINTATTHYLGSYVSGRYFSGYLADIHFIDGQALDPTSFGEFDTNGVWQPKAYTGTYGTNGFHLPFSDNSTAAALGTDTSGNGNDWTVNNITANSTTYTGSHRYWKAVTYSYTSHFPRSSRLVLSGPAGDTNIVVFTTDNCSDSGTIPSSGDSFSYDFGSNRSITSFKFYSVYNGGSRTGRVSVYYSDDNSNWYQAFTAVCSNNSSCGLISAVNENTAVSIDSLVDTPTNYGTDTGAGGEVRGNYATLNPLKKVGYTLSNGNLDIAQSGAACGVVGSIALPPSGKWYWEITPTHASATEYFYGIIGEPSTSSNLTTAIAPANFVLAGYYGFPTPVGRIMKNSFTDLQSGLPYRGSGYTWGIAVDVDANTIQFYTNGSAYGTLVSTALTSGVTYLPWISSGNNTDGTHSGSLNFGQRPFAYPAPSGFKALCTTNLPEPLVAKPSEVMDVVLYTGNSTDNRAITGLGFSPDLVWFGPRSQSGQDKVICDSVRGVQKALFSNQTYVEADPALYGSVGSFDSNGFTIKKGIDATFGFNQVNLNSSTYAAWTWDAGSSTVTNTQGSITSQVRANPSAGFSIVTYTGTGANATVGHGLGVAPSFVIVKSRNNVTDWQGYHVALGKDYTIQLHSSAAALNTPNYWNGGISSTAIGVNGSYDGINFNGYTYVAYCFAPVAGYSSAFTYTGNGSNSGPFVYLGFRPRFFFVKRTDSTGDWWMYDAARNPYNVTNYALRANSSAAEVSDVGLDMLSNGFRYVNDIGAPNISGASYVGFAFAESPFQYARAR